MPRPDVARAARPRAAREASELASAIARCSGPVDFERATQDWARSGAMWLTGFPDAPPLMAPAAFATACARAVDALRSAAARAGLRARPQLAALDGALLLGERAAALGLSRSGAVSAGGACRLLATRDGSVALQLAREDDIALLDAWLERPRGGDEPWTFVRRELAERSSDDVVARAREMGLACAVAAPPPRATEPWLDVRELAAPVDVRPARAPLAVDLSALWAGPLCGQLLAQAGARVVKVESTRRPDGARDGSSAFFDLINGDKASVALDFASGDGRAALLRLIEAADIVIEASRPRALAQLGIEAERVVARGRGATWVSITGYGRGEPESSWIAFGDDAAVAAGATDALRAREAALGRATRACFCGDALADPLTGAHAAAAALASHADGGGRLVSLSLCGVTRALLADAPIEARDTTHAAQAPRMRATSARAPALGADTNAVLASLPC